MWWSRLRLAAFGAAILAALSACGFRPLYSEGSAAGEIHRAFSVDTGEGAFAFILRERLQTRLGPGDPARFRLSVVTTIDTEERAIRADRSILRFNLEAVARFTVRPVAGEATLFTDQVTAFTAYSAIASPFATRAAAEDAERRLATNLADQIVLRLAATSQDWME